MIIEGALSSPLFIWGDQYLTGINAIDQQHQKLVNMINALYAARQQHYAADILQALFDDLGSYLVEHLDFEEALLEQHHYPQCESHRAEHRRFRDNLQQLQHQCPEGGQEVQGKLVDQLLDFLKEWFVKHVLVSDMAYAPHVRQHSTAQRAQPASILVVDDEQEVLSLYRRALTQEQGARQRQAGALFAVAEGQSQQQERFALTTASQGAEAIEQVREALQDDTPFQVAFIDMMMPPGIDGMETARVLRMLDERIHIIFVTAYSEKRIEQLDRALYHDILLLRKPFASEEVRQMALTLSRNWNKMRTLEREASHHQLELELLQREQLLQQRR